jgi:hypothetical protein
MTRALRLLFWLSVAFSFVMATLPHPPPIPGEPVDKVQHMMAFSTMSLLGALGYARFGLVRLGVALSAFGAFIEFVQMIPALHRDAEFLDWVADTAAVVVVLGLVALVRAILTRRARAN